jgi:hypothetical protein
MNLETVNKISGLDLYVFFNPSSKIVTAHFFSSDGVKPNIMAYLKRDMSWDVREIIEETSTLEDDQEVIVVRHKILGIENKDGDFDKFIRVGVEKLIELLPGNPDLTRAAEILKQNSYRDDA